MYTHPAYKDLIGLGPFQPVIDEHGSHVNVILVNRMFLEEQHEVLFHKYKNDILFLGIMSFEAFPYPSPNPYSVQFPHDKYLDMFPGWLNMYREDSSSTTPMFGPNVKVLQMSQSDFSLPEIQYDEEVEQGLHEKKYDFTYSMSDLDLSTGGQCNSWGSHAKNWTFVRDYALDVMCGELNMTGVLLVTKDFSGKTCDIPPSCHGKMIQTTFLPQNQVYNYMRQSRFLFLPQIYDASPRVATQALTFNIPLLMNKNIVGGWKYINENTGEFFHDITDLRDSIHRLYSNMDNYKPRDYVLNNYGNQNAGKKLHEFITANFNDRVDLPPESELLIPVFN